MTSGTAPESMSEMPWIKWLDLDTAIEPNGALVVALRRPKPEHVNHDGSINAPVAYGVAEVAGLGAAVLGILDILSSTYAVVETAAINYRVFCVRRRNRDRTGRTGHSSDGAYHTRTGRCGTADGRHRAVRPVGPPHRHLPVRHSSPTATRNVATPTQEVRPCSPDASTVRLATHTVVRRDSEAGTDGTRQPVTTTQASRHQIRQCSAERPRIWESRVHGRVGDRRVDHPTLRASRRRPHAVAPTRPTPVTIRATNRIERHSPGRFHTRGTATPTLPPAGRTQYRPGGFHCQRGRPSVDETRLRAPDRSRSRDRSPAQPKSVRATRHRRRFGSSTASASERSSTRCTRPRAPDTRSPTHAPSGWHWSSSRSTSPG